MLDLPTPIIDYIYRLTLESRSPAYFLVDKAGCLCHWGGNLSAYGVRNLQTGDYVEQQVLFLAGLLPLDDEPIFLPCIKMESGLSADIHIFSTTEGDWVLLLDASLHEIQRSQVQQKSNDLSLIRKKQSRILHQQLGNYVTDRIKGELNIRAEGERRDVTVLRSHLCEFNLRIKNYSPQEALKTLNSYLSTLTQPILDEGGMVDKILGSAVISLFGVLPATGSNAIHALKAALRIIEAVWKVSKFLEADNGLTFDTGIGITSGSVILGTIGSNNSKTLITTGDRITLAETLTSMTHPSEILIDDNTFNQLGDLQKHFLLTTTLDPKMIEPTRIYSYRLK